MSSLKTKMAAAVAAVQAYLQEEQAQLATAQQQASPPPVYGPPPWAMSGRQEIMTLRRLIQFKAF